MFYFLCGFKVLLSSSQFASADEINLDLFITAGKPELPRQPGSSAFYDSESPQPAQTPDSSNATEPESPMSNDTNSSNFFQTLDWEGNALLYSVLLICNV